MSERTLSVSRGNLTFNWRITSSTIQMFEWDPEAEQPTRNLGMLYAISEEGKVVEFDQEAFEAHIDWFLAGAASAGITEPECNGKCVGSPNFGVTVPDPDCPLHKGDPPQVA